jgi:hypothetical protein
MRVFLRHSRRPRSKAEASSVRTCERESQTWRMGTGRVEVEVDEVVEVELGFLPETEGPAAQRSCEHIIT